MTKAKSKSPSQIRKLLARCQLMKNPELKRAVGNSESSMSLEYIDISPEQLSKTAAQSF
ncbi:putative site-specific recombinase [Vibrio cholerae]|nr:putative site-specific recombinase [Vibrio cholerae]